MLTAIDAIFENGVFRPVVPLNLPEGRQVQVVVDVGDSPANCVPETPTNSRKAEEMSEEELEACFDELSAGPDLPILPDSAYTREGIYEGG
jgi:predicted DNA-binding antitoxin AbrB/MazE fold protein